MRTLIISIYTFSCFACTLFTQPCNIEIIIKDFNDKTLLDFVSISFKNPDNKNWDIEFTNQDGSFKTQQNRGVEIKYNMTYLGYFEQSLNIVCGNDTKLTYVIEMKKSAIKLEEIIITDKFPAIIEKKDTVIYSVTQFTTGKEEKLKEVLNKLPGIHVDRNNEVTFNGEKVIELLVENDKFFTGDPGLAVKYIPANAVERVEVLERHNHIKILKNASINEKLTLNIRLKTDKKKLIFGEIVGGTNISDRHILHSNAFYYSSTFTANNISDLKTTQDDVLKQSELFRVMGLDMDNYDPKSRPANFEQINRFSRVIGLGNAYDQKSLFSIQQLRYKTRNKITIEGILVGFEKDDKSGTKRIVTFPDETIENQYSNQITNSDTRYKNADFTFSSNPEKNYFISYNFRFTDNISKITDTSTNEFSMLSNTLNHNGILGNSNIEHKAKYIQQWHKKLQSILILNQTYQRQHAKYSWDAQGLFIPGFYNQVTQNVRIINDGSLPGNNTYFLARTNYNINFKSKAHLFLRYESTNQALYSQVASQELIQGTMLPLISISDMSGSSEFIFKNIVGGGRYIISDQINELNSGVDYQNITYQFNQINLQRGGRISPFIDASRNINRVGRLGISYQFDFKIPTLTQLNPFYTSSQFNNFIIGDIGIAPEQKNSFGVSLRKSNTMKGVAQNLSLMYSLTYDPIISAFDIQNNSFIETFYNSSKSKNDLSIHFIFSKVINKMRIFNNFLATYSHFYQRVRELESPFRQFSVIHRLSLAKDWEKIELSLQLSNTVRNIPLNTQTSKWIYQPEANAEIKYYVTKNWLWILNSEYNALLSKNLKQTNFPLNTQIQYKTTNEKYKIHLILNNVLGQTNLASNRVDVFSSSLTTQRIFPRYFYFSFTFVF